jgi:D-alanyl-D-alanine dipeptidase
MLPILHRGAGITGAFLVDLTITDLSTGKDLDMGTGFDNFSDTAHHDFKDLPAQVIQNRLLLRTLMEKHGFIALETEWWHYYLPDSKTYELLDISFEELSRIE